MATVSPVTQTPPPVARPRQDPTRSPRCPRCVAQPLAPSRVRWYEYPILLTRSRPHRCPLCYARFWRLPRRRRVAGEGRAKPAGCEN